MKKIITIVLACLVGGGVYAQEIKNAEQALSVLENLYPDQKENPAINNNDVEAYYGCTTELERRAFRKRDDYQQKVAEFEQIRNEALNRFVVLDFESLRCNWEFDLKSNRYHFTFTNTYEIGSQTWKEYIEAERFAYSKKLPICESCYIVEPPVGYYKTEFEQLPPEKVAVDEWNPKYECFQKVMKYNKGYYQYTKHIYGGKLTDEYALEIEQKLKNARREKLLFVCTKDETRIKGKIVYKPVAIYIYETEKREVGWSEYKMFYYLFDVTGSLKGAEYERFQKLFQSRLGIQKDKERVDAQVKAQVEAQKTAIRTRGYATDSEVEKPARVSFNFDEPSAPHYEDHEYSINGIIKDGGITFLDDSKDFKYTRHSLEVVSQATIAYADGTKGVVPTRLTGKLTEKCKILVSDKDKHFEFKMAFDKTASKWYIKNRDKLAVYLAQHNVSSDLIVQMEELLSNGAHKQYVYYIRDIYQYTYDIELNGAIVNNTSTTTYKTQKEFPVMFRIESRGK